MAEAFGFGNSILRCVACIRKRYKFSEALGTNIRTRVERKPAPRSDLTFFPLLLRSLTLFWIQVQVTIFLFLQARSCVGSDHLQEWWVVNFEINFFRSGRFSDTVKSVRVCGPWGDFLRREKLFSMPRGGGYSCRMCDVLDECCRI